MVHVFIIHSDRDLSTDEFDCFLALVSEEKREKINKFHFYADKQRTLLGEMLVRYGVKNCFSLNHTELIFDKGEYGKPFLKSHPEIQYNISHAGDYVVCAIGRQIPLGIDVEVMKPIDSGIAKRFFTPAENEYINLKPTELQIEAFYSVWTKKESYIKMSGKGLSIPLNSFDRL